MNPTYKFFINITEESSSVTTETIPLTINLPQHGMISIYTGKVYEGNDYREYISNYIEMTSDYEISWNMEYQMCVGVYDADKKYVNHLNGKTGSIQTKRGQFIRMSYVYQTATITETYTNKTTTPAESREVHPIYKELQIQAQRENEQKFLRKKLDGKLTFVKDDYDFIDAQDFDFEFVLSVQQSFDQKNYTEVIKARFFKTDGEWNPADRIVRISCRTMDEYDDVMSNLDREFNIIELLPEIKRVRIERGLALQTYVLGSDVIGYYHEGSYWEDDVNSSVESDAEMSKYHFEKAGKFVAIHYDNTEWVSAGVSGPSEFDGEYWGIVENDGTTYVLKSSNGKRAEYNNGTIRLYTTWTDGTLANLRYYDGNKWWSKSNPSYGFSTSNYQADVDTFEVYQRLLLSAKVGGASSIPVDDIANDNRNYRFCIKASFPNSIVISGERSKTPTKYGKMNDDYYFSEPSDNGIFRYSPIAKSSWITHSLWLNTRYLSLPAYECWFTLKHTYTLSSVIARFLEKFSSIKHDETCSDFLYKNLQLSGNHLQLLITPKSNLLHGDYDRPAQTCKTTLGTILSALRDMFRCYWYIEDGKLKIEHESFFREGGEIIDLSKILVRPNGKSWSLGQEEYSYDKSNMPKRFAFSWMDKVSQAYDTDGVEIRSRFVDSTQSEVSVSNITTDIGYIMLCPNAVSEDGMVMLSAGTSDTGSLQVDNRLLQWKNLVKNYYGYAFPSRKIRFEGEDINLEHVSYNCKMKVKFPLVEGFTASSKIKTLTSYAVIEKYSLSLQSLLIEAELAYDNQ